MVIENGRCTTLRALYCQLSGVIVNRWMDASLHRAISIHGRSRLVLWVHNEHLVAGQCAIGCTDGDRPGGGPIRDGGLDKRGIDELEGCGCSVEENLGCVGEALSQNLHLAAGAAVGGQVRHERRQSGIKTEKHAEVRRPSAGSHPVEASVSVLHQRTSRTTACGLGEIMQHCVGPARSQAKEYSRPIRSTVGRRPIQVSITCLNHTSYRPAPIRSTAEAVEDVDGLIWSHLEDRTSSVRAASRRHTVKVSAHSLNQAAGWMIAVGAVKGVKHFEGTGRSDSIQVPRTPRPTGVNGGPVKREIRSLHERGYLIDPLEQGHGMELCILT